MRSFYGLLFNIENPAGTVRRGKGWATLMKSHYGEIPGTRGPDGDPLDVFLPKKGFESDKLTVVHQQNPETKEYDEDKIMVGFPSENAAVSEYFKHYDKPEEFYLGHTTWTKEEFFKMLTESKGEPGKLDWLAKRRWVKDLLAD